MDGEAKNEKKGVKTKHAKGGWQQQVEGRLLEEEDSGRRESRDSNAQMKKWSRTR